MSGVVKPPRPVDQSMTYSPGIAGLVNRFNCGTESAATFCAAAGPKLPKDVNTPTAAGATVTCVGGNAVELTVNSTSVAPLGTSWGTSTSTDGWTAPITCGSKISPVPCGRSSTLTLGGFGSPTPFGTLQKILSSDPGATCRAPVAALAAVAVWADNGAANKISAGKMSNFAAFINNLPEIAYFT